MKKIVKIAVMKKTKEMLLCHHQNHYVDSRTRNYSLCRGITKHNAVTVFNVIKNCFCWTTKSVFSFVMVYRFSYSKSWDFSHEFFHRWSIVHLTEYADFRHEYNNIKYCPWLVFIFRENRMWCDVTCRWSFALFCLTVTTKVYLQICNPIFVFCQSVNGWWTNGYCQEDGAISHISNTCIEKFSFFEDKIIPTNFWPPIPIDLTFDFFLWDLLKSKCTDKTPHTIE